MMQNGNETEFWLAEDLLRHRYFRHTVDVLLNHPYKNELIALHAAILVDGARIISVGYNKPWRPKIVRMIKNAHENLSTHAEIDAINKSKKRDVFGTTMYVARILKDKKTIAISKPCHYCQSAMDSVGIQKAIYTTYHGTIQEMKIKPPFTKNEKRGGCDLYSQI